MNFNRLGKTGLMVSGLSFGASALSGMFKPADESTAIKAVHTALNCGINYFDVAPAYGSTRSETILGRALKGVPRTSYYLSTKVGKYTDASGIDFFDYSEKGIYKSLRESAERLGTEYFDIIHLHDIEYQNQKHTEQALNEGYETLQELKSEGRIGAVSFGIYPLNLWKRIISDYHVDTALVHNHYCLNDNSLLSLLPELMQKDIGVINASPFGSGLLTDQGPADWHPASQEERSLFNHVAQFCRENGTSVSKLALQFASQHPSIPTTMFSTTNPESVLRNVAWHEEPVDMGLVEKVQSILRPLLNKQWNY